MLATGVTRKADARLLVRWLRNEMKRRDWIRRQWLRFVCGETVPGARPLLLSVTAHGVVLLVLVGLVLFYRSAPVVVFPGRLQVAQRISTSPVSLPPRSKGMRLQIEQKNARRVPRKAQKPVAESTGEDVAVQALRERARLETKALLQDFKFRMTYGFSPSPKYELAFQTSGQIPVIAADQLPPRFEQYVVVEVTITAEGQVADARIVAGEVDSKIQQTLLAAIREFKYRPATREGIPVPSQCDIVIHIPT